MCYKRNYREWLDFCGRWQRLKFPPPAVYYHLNFSVSLCVFIFYFYFFFQDTPVCEFTEKPGTIYCVTFRPRFFPPYTDTPFAPFTLYTTHRRFLPLNLWKLLCSRVSHSFQFRKFLQMSHHRRTPLTELTIFTPRACSPVKAVIARHTLPYCTIICL